VELGEDEAHGARADAIASGRVVQRQLQDFFIRPHGPKALMALQKQWRAEQAASLQEYLRTKAPEPDPEAVVNGEWPLIPRSSE
jgi:DNA polymerase-3 subunit epsilon